MGSSKPENLQILVCTLIFGWTARVNSLLIAGRTTQEEDYANEQLISIMLSVWSFPVRWMVWYKVQDVVDISFGNGITQTPRKCWRPSVSWRTATRWCGQNLSARQTKYITRSKSAPYGGLRACVRNDTILMRVDIGGKVRKNQCEMYDHTLHAFHSILPASQHLYLNPNNWLILS